MALTLATWNVNSVKARLANVLAWLAETKPDLLLMQEIKCVDDQFPALEFKAAGYGALIHGQKTYNGVAILMRDGLPVREVRRGLPGEPEDLQARYLEAEVHGLRLASLYLPNGNPAPGDKYDYKLRWMDRLYAHAQSLMAEGTPFALAGDYNICPTDDDVHDPEGFASDALCRPPSRARFRALKNLGLTDAYLACHPNARHKYTFWDYQAGAWQKDNGLRIDHFLLNPEALDRLQSCDIDRRPRGAEKASDHTPVVCRLDFGP